MIWLAALVMFGQVADVISTVAAISSGRGREANALFVALDHGAWSLLLVKLLIAAVVVAVALVRLSGGRRVVCLVVLAALSWWAPAHNVAVLQAEASGPPSPGHHGPCNTVGPMQRNRLPMQREAGL